MENLCVGHKVSMRYYQSMSAFFYSENFFLEINNVGGVEIRYNVITI